VFYINFSEILVIKLPLLLGLDASNGKAVVIIDGDLQDLSELITDLFKKIPGRI
jgi:hypothetical protein